MTTSDEITEDTQSLIDKSLLDDSLPLCSECEKLKTPWNDMILCDKHYEELLHD